MKNENQFEYMLEVDGGMVPVVFHIGVHGEELASLLLLYKYGTKAFLEEYADSDGRLYIGTGGGKLDEHANPAEGILTAKDESSLMLVVKALGLDLDKMSTIKNIVQYMSYVDGHARDLSRGLANMIKKMHRKYPDDPRGVIQWALQAFLIKFHDSECSYDMHNADDINALIGSFEFNHILSVGRKAGMDVDEFERKGVAAEEYSAKELFGQAREEYAKKAKRMPVYVPVFNKDGTRALDDKGKPKSAKRPFAVIHSDNLALPKYSRSNEARAADTHASVLAVIRSSGHKSVFTDARYKFSLRKVVAELRNATLRKKGLPELAYGNPLLYAEGHIEGVPEFFYSVQDSDAIYNWTETHPNNPVTELSDDEFIRIVKNNIMFRA
ncbi:MAG: hypothetical protein COU47_01165 [Candidatus Niyogibacteria bacterium CG10_big_fil_rev_8_21_14_0_10_46_36]|uniref:Uncharacterized protein n=1 Tax=Candidatus Niyogibacteria bacterium CG10_big_fil_rev_8_21_14_0_10_46_36 TaxID=1974726 RepID=A0A2H0TFV2_9BACT|nr:MAG: hypothetical protein COU47_01165 [Candidatus Niyogibacteria bacterium CG10_big_fil_rev_8_21_14_0_10_46_36]